MVLRSDPSCATGYAPGELLLGRKLVYPIELEKSEVDLTGNFLLFYFFLQRNSPIQMVTKFFLSYLYS